MKILIACFGLNGDYWKVVEPVCSFSMYTFDYYTHEIPGCKGCYRVSEKTTGLAVGTEVHDTFKEATKYAKRELRNAGWTKTADLVIGGLNRMSNVPMPEGWE